MVSKILTHPFVLTAMLTTLLIIYTIAEDAAKDKLDEFGTLVRKILVTFILVLGFMFLATAKPSAMPLGY